MYLYYMQMLYMIVFLSKSPESFKKLLFATKFNEISIFLGMLLLIILSPQPV